MIVKPTAQLVTSESSQVAASIHEKLCIGDIMFLGESMQDRCPQNAVLMGCTRTPFS